MKEENIFTKKSFAFAVQIINAVKEIQECKREFIITKQLIRSGTAIGALIRESQNAESKADFVHKLAISQKECDETIYWIDILYATNYINEITHSMLKSNAEELLRLIRSSIITTKQKYIYKSIHKS